MSATLHPHDLEASVPDRLSADEVQSLSAIDPVQVALALAVDWGVMALSIGVAVWSQSWLLVPISAIIVGSRQHALAILAHDAVHFRLLGDRTVNDVVGNVLCAWPLFFSVEGFRHFHGTHHRHLGEEKDGNRQLWRTHHPTGEPKPEWQYPKSALGLSAKILWRSAFLTGAWWIVRGLIGGVLFGTSKASALVRYAAYATLAVVLAVTGLWSTFAWYWLLPLCTWFVAVQYLRLACEHSAIRSATPAYAATRTTIPGPLGRFFVLPRNIGYHIEHHWYPGVPFYRLPALHERLMKEPGFRDHAVIHRSIPSSLSALVAKDLPRVDA